MDDIKKLKGAISEDDSRRLTKEVRGEGELYRYRCIHVCMYIWNIWIEIEWGEDRYRYRYRYRERER